MRDCKEDFVYYLHTNTNHRLTLRDYDKYSYTDLRGMFSCEYHDFCVKLMGQMVKSPPWKSQYYTEENNPQSKQKDYTTMTTNQTTSDVIVNKGKLSTINIVPIIDKLESTYTTRIKEYETKASKMMEAEATFKLKQKELELKEKYEKLTSELQEKVEKELEKRKAEFDKKEEDLKKEIDMEADRIDFLKEDIEKMKSILLRKQELLDMNKFEALNSIIEKKLTTYKGTYFWSECDFVTIEQGSFFNKKKVRLTKEDAARLITKFAEKELGLK